MGHQSPARQERYGLSGVTEDRRADRRPPSHNPTLFETLPMSPINEEVSSERRITKFCEEGILKCRRIC